LKTNCSGAPSRPPKSSAGHKFPRIQLLTVRDLLEGNKHVERPLHVRDVTFRKAPRSRPDAPANLTLNLTPDD